MPRGRLCRTAHVSVMQATNFGKPHDPAQIRWRDGSDGRRILGERDVGACVMVVREVAGKNAAQVAFGEDEHMVQTLTYIHDRRGTRSRRRREHECTVVIPVYKQPGEAPYATRLQAAVRANPTYSHHSANAQYKFNGVKSAK
jgi:hypothetical protein